MVLEAPARPSLNGHHEVPVRRVALVARVSTDRQAANPEGSLTTQLQRLRQHIEYKCSVAGEEWREVEVYELRAVSGKDSMRSDEYEELFAVIRAGRVNTILCTALERLCRSVKDFLHFVEFINEHGAEFVCLKQAYDTTTPQGRLTSGEG
ncbi:MAG: recombinase family protein [Dehalococcoidia bacterium]